MTRRPRRGRGLGRQAMVSGIRSILAESCAARAAVARRRERLRESRCCAQRADDGSVVGRYGGPRNGTPLARDTRRGNECSRAVAAVEVPTMPQQTLASRVDSLERRVKSLEVLPGRMDRLESQFLQMRQEVRSEFSAVRAEIRAG